MQKVIPNRPNLAWLSLEEGEIELTPAAKAGFLLRLGVRAEARTYLEATATATVDSFGIERKKLLLCYFWNYGTAEKDEADGCAGGELADGDGGLFYLYGAVGCGD